MKKISFIVVPLALFIFSVPAMADEIEEWKFSISPYLWMPHIDGEIIVKNHEAKFDMDFNDIFNLVNYGLMLRGEAWHGKYGLMADVMYLNLSKEVNMEHPYVNVEAKISGKAVFSDFTLGYQLKDFPQMSGVSFEALAGFRYVYLQAKLNYEGTAGPTVYDGKWQDREYWFDPILGGRVKINLTDKLLVAVRADVGGFNVGSDMSWHILSEIDYRIWENASLNIGYRLLDIDYKSGNDRDEFQLDTRLSGPTVSMTFFF